MPLCTLYLLKLRGHYGDFLKQLTPADNVLLASVPQFAVINAEVIDSTALNKEWDLLLLTKGGNALSDKARALVTAEYVVKAGVPSRLVDDFAAKNKELRGRRPPPLTGSLDKPVLSDSSQALMLSNRIRGLAKELKTKPGGKAPTTMLNLLAFKEGMLESYHKYGQGFAKVGGLRGGAAKVMGNAIDSPWNEIALAHYPSIDHFCDMLAGEDYQEINAKYRLPALKDTLLICTLEVDLEGRQSKL